MSDRAAGDGDATREPIALRGEAAVLVAGTRYTLRPSFGALVAAEEELGPLFALVDRASEGKLRLTEMVALFWHCLERREELTREKVGEAMADAGLAACARPLRALLAAILQGT